MDLLVALLANTALALLSILELCMLVRAVLSWFMPRGDHPVMTFLYTVTEPIILPFRHLFDRMGWFRNSPLDIPFLAAVLVLALSSTLLQVLA